MKKINKFLKKIDIWLSPRIKNIFGGKYLLPEWNSIKVYKHGYHVKLGDFTLKYEKSRKILFKIWLYLHGLKCKYWNWHLIELQKKGLLTKKYSWEYWIWKIEGYLCRKKHKLIALSLKDFRFYIYCKKVREGWL